MLRMGRQGGRVPAGVVYDVNICFSQTVLFRHKQQNICTDQGKVLQTGSIEDVPTFFFSACRDEPLRSFRDTTAALIMSTYGGWEGAALGAMMAVSAATKRGRELV